MGWQDREYNAGREEMKAYFANPLGLMQFALPIWRSAGLQVRLSFWFLLSALFVVIEDLRGGLPLFIPLDLMLMLGVCLFHEWGHRIFARLVGGNHWEWVLWPLGGMVAPSAPRTAKATFVANVGGIVFNLLLIGAVVGTVIGLGGDFTGGRGMFLPELGVILPGGKTLALIMIVHALGTILMLCAGMILMNLFPCYWFDGGHLWQAVLWPMFGQWKAGMITCLAGMVLAVPFFFVSLLGGPGNLLMILFWVLIFADCFRRRQALVAAGPGVVDEDDTSYNYLDTPEPRVRKKRKKRWFSQARKRALADQAEQARIDAILAKVKEKGLHSLSWWEKRTLRKATARQRQQDMVGRL